MKILKLEELEGKNVANFPDFKITDCGIGHFYKGTIGPKIAVVAYRNGVIIKAEKI